MMIPIERLDLMGFLPLTNIGFALPCYAKGERPNLWYAAVCDVSGDHGGKIIGFDELYAENIQPLPKDSWRCVEVGDRWCDVFLWRGNLCVGCPDEIWEQLAPLMSEISGAAPLSILELGMDVASADHVRLARNAHTFVLDRLGKVRADLWINDSVLRQALIRRLRRIRLDRGLDQSLHSIATEVEINNSGGHALEVVWPDEWTMALRSEGLFDSVNAQMRALRGLFELPISQSAMNKSSNRLLPPRQVARDATASVGNDGSGMLGPNILVRTLSKPTRADRYGRQWQYHSRSDHHSKVACWGVLFDLLRTTPLLRRHVETGVVWFGINHEMRDFVHDRKKNLDVVLCTGTAGPVTPPQTLVTLAQSYGIELLPDEEAELRNLPVLTRAPVGAVLLALEAKACMTAHQRALPRLYDELNSSHLTVHGASDQAIAAGFAMVNIAERYLSPDLNKKNFALGPEWSRHNQPRDATLAVDKVRQLPKRSKPGDTGYDALAIVVVDCPNDGSEVKLVETFPAPQRGDIYAYTSMIDRLSHIYATRFKDL